MPKRRLSLACLAILAAAAAIVACSGSDNVDIAPGDADGSTPQSGSDASTSTGVPPGPSSKGDGGGGKDGGGSGDASASDGGGDGGDGGTGACPLPRAWVDTTDGTGYAQLGGLVVVAKSPMAFGTTLLKKGMGQDETWLWLSHKQGPAFVKSEYQKVGGCVTSGGLVGCAADEYAEILTENDADAHTVAYLTQVHNKKYGYGTFELAKIDPFSGGTLRQATMGTQKVAVPSSVVATKTKATGYDVVVVGTANVGFVGETGTGAYFRATYKNFLSPTCTPAATRIAPDTLERAATPFAL